MWMKALCSTVAAMCCVGVLLSPAAGAAEPAPPEEVEESEDRGDSSKEDDSIAGEGDESSQRVERTSRDIRGRQMISGTVVGALLGAYGWGIVLGSTGSGFLNTGEMAGLTLMVVGPMFGGAAGISLTGYHSGFSSRFGRTFLGALVGTATWMAAGAVAEGIDSEPFRWALIGMHPLSAALGGVIGYQTGDTEYREASGSLELTPMMIVDDDGDEYGGGLEISGRF